MNRYHVVKVYAWPPTGAATTPPLVYRIADYWNGNQCATVDAYSTRELAQAAADEKQAQSMAVDYTAHYDGMTGAHVCSIPNDAIGDCSGPGQKDDAVAYWLPFVVWHADRESLNAICKESGGWVDEDLTAEDEDTIRARVLWMACNQINEDNNEGAEDEDE